MNRESIYGRQAVREVLRAGRRTVFLLQLAETARAQGPLEEILTLARKKNIRMEKVPGAALDKLGGNHQGVAVYADEYPLAPLEEILTRLVSPFTISWTKMSAR